MPMLVLTCRASDDLVLLRQSCTAVSQESLDDAVQWLWQLERTDGVGRTSTAEAVMKALTDSQVRV